MLNIARKTQWVGGFVNLPAALMRRAAFFVLIVATSAYGVSKMFDILGANGLTTLELVILVLFGITFAWIVVAFWTAVAGFILDLFRLDPLSLKRQCCRFPPDLPIATRTAVIMPIYNEDTDRVIAGFEATYRDLLATGEAEHFDFHLLSDTTDPVIAAAEEVAWRDLCERLGGDDRLFYRRRQSNTGRKVGNIVEFCQRCGHDYDCMVVLDADSIMSGQALTSLVRAMQANPQAGMIQTVPLPVRQDTFFGRFVQFAASLYGPMLSAGMSFWQMDAANYWGHNAIIRIRPFMDHCNLPVLPGKPPLGGEILSHDFVESAYMRRAGWHVYLLPEIGGSYEEVPSNICDFVQRDRRWAEGNLQHLLLVGDRGLHPMSRLHFIMGAFAYLSSFLWLITLAAGTVDAVSRALSTHQFFASGHQLYPDWPIAKTEEMMSLLFFVVLILLSPKAMALGLALARREIREGHGGSGRLLLSALIETIFAILIAPIMMTFHAYFVTNVLMGRRVVWGPQNRTGRYVPLNEAFRSTYVALLGALVWGALTFAITPIFFWALTPVLVGLLLAGPLITVSSSLKLGERLRQWGLFLTPSEVRPPKVLRRMDRSLVANRSAEAIRTTVEDQAA